MSKELYRYTFRPHVPLEEIEATLLLALWGAESLHGEIQVRLDAAHFLDADRRACVIDAGTPVGRDVNRLFIGFVQREFGNDAFRVERVGADNNQQTQEVHA
ncbi:MAG: hypothetical protein KatS3mg082_1935 [Nitrospiraceae bacterium]|nr:MAG: hypothetical protein KatS3mg082_1935 [Nitrospiraceae bacterium]